MRPPRAFPEGSLEQLRAALMQARRKGEFQRVQCLWLRTGLDPAEKMPGESSRLYSASCARRPLIAMVNRPSLAGVDCTSLRNWGTTERSRKAAISQSVEPRLVSG